MTYGFDNRTFLQTLSENIKELTRQLKTAETKVTDFSDDVSRLKRDLQKSETIENDLRRSIEQQNKENIDLRTAKDQVCCGRIFKYFEKQKSES